MRTQIIPEQALGLPWLEHFPAKGGPPEKTILDKSPFIIGRGESADLQVVSQGVSREHSSLECGRTTRIRDLGSTNGTFVNGQRIRETDLHDGDMVQVANVEFTFYCGKSQARQATVTQVLPLNADFDADGDKGQSNAAGELRRAVRRLHETLVSGCVRGRLKPIVDLRQGQFAGYEPADDDLPHAGRDSNPLLPAIPGRVDARLRHVQRMRGVERAAAQPGEHFIFVHVSTAEIAAGGLLAVANSVCDLVADASRLVIAAPYAAAKEATDLLAPGGPLNELGVTVALSDLGVREAGAALLAEIRPGFVGVAPLVIRGINGNAKNLRTLQSIIRAAKEFGSQVIAAGISTPAERASCLEAGCDFGQGVLFEQQKRAEAPSRRVNPIKSTAVDAFFLSPKLDGIKRS